MGYNHRDDKDHRDYFLCLIKFQLRHEFVEVNYHREDLVPGWQTQLQDKPVTDALPTTNVGLKCAHVG
jgi:hypothetical protein